MAPTQARPPDTKAKAASRRTGGPKRPGRPKRHGAEVPAPSGSSTHTGNLQTEALTSSFGYLLRRLQLAYKSHFLRKAGTKVVPPRYVGAMYVVALNPGVTPSQMSAALGLDAVQTALLLNALEERDFIERRLSPTDGRSRSVHLTPAGRKMFLKLQVVAKGVEQDFASAALTQQETAQLISLMARLLEANK